jgi:hypothetical protein
MSYAPAAALRFPHRIAINNGRSRLAASAKKALKSKTNYDESPGSALFTMC